MSRTTKRNWGGRFEVDIQVDYPFSRAASEDTLHEAVDYQQVYAVVKDMVTERKYHLIETLADHLADELIKNFDVEQVTVILRKRKVPINAVLDYVEVEVNRKRGDA